MGISKHYSRIKKNVARYRRSKGIFCEPLERQYARYLKIPCGDTSTVKLEVSPLCSYTVAIKLSTPAKISLTASHNAEITYHPVRTRTHRLLLFSSNSKQIDLTLSNSESETLEIDSIDCKVNSFDKGNSSYARHLLKAGHISAAKDLGQLPANQQKWCTDFLNLLDLEPDILELQKGAESDQYLYLLHSSIAYSTTGYTTRSQSILQHLNAKAYTRLGYPEISTKQVTQNLAHLSQLNRPPSNTTVDKVTYHTLYDEGGAPRKDISTIDYIHRSVAQLVEELKNSPPKGVIAASNYLNGLVGYQLAKTLHCPFTYEMRGLWHLTKLVKEPYWAESEEFHFTEKLELHLAEKADQVVVLSPSMKAWLIDHNIDASKIKIAANGIDSEKFSPKSKPSSLLEKYDLQGKIVFSFIGSLVEYEGVELLIEAFNKLHIDDPNTALVIVGDGVERKHLERISRNSISIHMVGRVAFSEITDFYHLADIMVYPRTNQPVCQIVPPIKPLESMASGKITLCSEVAPMMDYLNNGTNGFSFQPDSVDDLYKSMLQAMKQKDSLGPMKARALNYVRDNHQWKNSARVLDFLSK